jgi:hypothetical protein
LQTGVFPYTALTIVLTVATLLAVVVTRLLRVKGKQSEVSTKTAATSED